MTYSSPSVVLTTASVCELFNLMIIALISLILGFAGGFYAGVKNANSSKISKGKELLDALKSKE